LYKCTNDEDAGLNRDLAVQNAGEHDRAVLGENVRRMLDVMPSL